MKILKHALLFAFSLLILLILKLDAHAQSDYIITNDDKKVMGEVKNHNVDKVKFVPAGEKKSKKFKPEDIKEAFKAGHGIFQSHNLPNGKGPSFLQLLENGNIKLYEFFKNGYTSAYGAPVSYGASGTFMIAKSNPTRYWYARKEGGELVEIKSNQIWGSRKNRKDNFSELIKDNPHVADRYQTEDKFTFDFVRSLIVEYNSTQAK
jgi:hypothetical protein